MEISLRTVGRLQDDKVSMALYRLMYRFFYETHSQAFSHGFLEIGLFREFRARYYWLRLLWPQNMTRLLVQTYLNKHYTKDLKTNFITSFTSENMISSIATCNQFTSNFIQLRYISNLYLCSWLNRRKQNGTLFTYSPWVK